jgi:hypothetical protein
MNEPLGVTAVAEAALGLVLLVHPPIIVRLLLGAEIVGAGVAVSRVAGIALVALGVACWPGRADGRGVNGMLTYSLLVTLYLVYLGISGEWVGTLLWPAAAVHAALTFLLGRSWLRDRHGHVT